MTATTNPLGPAVLAGVDCSPRSTAVLQWADEQARRTGAQLVALTAWGNEPGAEEWPDPATAATAYRALAAAVAAALPKERAADAVLRVVPQTPVEALSVRADEVALVVIGAHHMHPMLPLGSVTAQVIGHGGCPVAVVRRRPLPTTGRVLVGVDGSPASRPALHWAIRQAKLLGAKVEAVLAWEWMPEFSVYPYGPPKESVHAQREQLLAAELDQLPADVSGLVHGVALEGDPAHVLLDAAVEADLLVVGSHGHGPVVGRLLGSVSQRVVRRSQVPVVVVPPTSERSS